MSKKKQNPFSLDEVLANLHSQAEAEWEAVDDAGNVIGGAAVAPSQASCHQATSSSGGWS
ncbi:MAG: hypothetical protein K1X88_23245 [Nannocystaceae bacterium]|nr:hypothetical protein [Nannocystaceae bacterium]